MATDMKDGGPAFPAATEYDGSGFRRQYPHDGMTLRDWFAGQALAGFVAGLSPDNEIWANHHGAAIHAYRFADAMLAARATKER